MIDKTGSINKIIPMQNNKENKVNTSQKISFAQAKDEFVKSTKGHKLIKSDEQMAKVLAENSFHGMLTQLIDRDFFHNGYDSIRFFISGKDKPCVMVGIKNFNTDVTEQYKYTPEEFIDLINKTKKEAEKEGQTNEANNDLCFKLIEKINQELEDSKDD